MRINFSSIDFFGDCFSGFFNCLSVKYDAYASFFTILQIEVLRRIGLWTNLYFVMKFYVYKIPVYNQAKLIKIFDNSVMRIFL